MSITREQLLTKRDEINKRIEDNKNIIAKKNEEFKCNRYYEGFGMASSMDKKTLILATDHLMHNDMDSKNEAATMLGFDPIDVSKMKYLGYTRDQWLHDFKLRAEVIRVEAEIKNLREAATIIERNLSDDDKFALDMKNLESLI